MKVESVNDQKTWDTFVTAGGGGLLQSWQWGQFRNETTWHAEHLAVRDGRQLQLTAMVLQKPLPLGYSLFYCPEGPVVKGGDWRDKRNQRAFQTLAKHLARRAKLEKVILFKLDPHIPLEQFPLKWLDRQGFRDSKEDIQPALVAHVDLTPSEEDILAAMKQKGRYNIRYAERQGVTVHSGTSPADLEVFYRLLKETARRQGITHRSRQYFELFRRHFMDSSRSKSEAAAEAARFFIASYQGKPLAATLVTFFGRESVYLYGGSSAEDRNTFASYLVQWEAMREAKRRGCTYYNMTGIAHSDDPGNAWYGLRQFKLKFGPEVVELPGARDYVYRPALYWLFTNADRARRLLAKTIGRARTQ